MNKIWIIVAVLLLIVSCAPTPAVQQQQQQPQPIIIVVTQVVAEPPQEVVQAPAQEQPAPQPQQQPVQQQPVQQPPQAQPVQQPPPPETITFTANRDLSCAEGPNWQLYWFVTDMGEYESAEVIAVNGDYGLVKLKGKECWVLLTEGLVSGSLSSLPAIEAPVLPIVKFTVANHLGIPIHLRIYDWNTGERVKQVDVGIGQEKEIKIPSGFYSIIAYDLNWVSVYAPGVMINLAAGDTYHLQSLQEGDALVVIDLP